MRGRPVPATEAEAGTMAMPTARDGIEWPLQIATVTQPGIDCRRKRVFETVWEMNLHHYVAGRFYLWVVSLPGPTPAVLDHHVDYRVIGQIANIRDVLKSGSLNSFTGPATFELDGYRRSYVSIAFEARQIINGVPSAANVPRLDMTICGRLFR